MFLPEYMVSVGDMAPDFELMAFDKNMVRLSDSIGNRVVLLFYPAAFTGGCTKEIQKDSSTTTKPTLN